MNFLKEKVIIVGLLTENLSRLVHTEIAELYQTPWTSCPLNISQRWSQGQIHGDGIRSNDNVSEGRLYKNLSNLNSKLHACKIHRSSIWKPLSKSFPHFRSTLGTRIIYNDKRLVVPVVSCNILFQSKKNAHLKFHHIHNSNLSYLAFYNLH